MLFVYYYPEGAHLHDLDCGVNGALVSESLSCDAIQADSAESAVLAVAKARVWDLPTALARCVFYPCTGESYSGPGDGDDLPPAPGEPDGASPGAPGVSVAAFRRRPLPFDESADPDDEILAALFGRRVTWINSLSGDREVAHLYPDGRSPETGVRYNKQTKLGRTSSGRRVLTFCSTEGGFRSLALETLLEVR